MKSIILASAILFAVGTASAERPALSKNKEVRTSKFKVHSSQEAGETLNVSKATECIYSFFGSTDDPSSSSIMLSLLDENGQQLMMFTSSLAQMVDAAEGVHVDLDMQLETSDTGYRATIYHDCKIDNNLVTSTNPENPNATCEGMIVDSSFDELRRVHALAFDKFGGDLEDNLSLECEF